MNNKVNYTFVGSVVLAIFIAMTFTIYWLMKPSDDSKQKNYLIYFNESVSGLNVNSPVKYRGVNVGKVEEIHISSKNTQEIEVLVSIIATTPIKVSTVATLNAQGITGLVFIDLSLGDQNSADLVQGANDKYPVIHSKPSLFQRFENSVGNMAEKLSGTLDGTNALLKEQNQKSITMTLQESQEFMRKLNLLLDDKSIEHLHSTMEHLDSITTKMDTQMMPKMDLLIDKSGHFTDTVSVSMASVASSYQVIQGSMAEFRRAIKDGEFNVKDISKGTVSNLNTSLGALQDVMLELESILKKYEDSPNDMLFKKQEIKKGPGEK
jgi:phospholipid/cholesterol/gamma-HCH transport system substrate-binding protein